METVLTVLNFLYLPPLTVLPGSTLFTPILTYFSSPSYLSSLGSPSAPCSCYKWQHQYHANMIVHGDPVCHHSNRDDVQSWSLLQSYLHLELLGDACSIPFHCPITSDMSCTTLTFQTSSVTKSEMLTSAHHLVSAALSHKLNVWFINVIAVELPQLCTPPLFFHTSTGMSPAPIAFPLFFLFNVPPPTYSTRSAFSLNVIIPPSLFVYFLSRRVYLEIWKFIRHTKNSRVSLITVSVAVQSPRNTQHSCFIFTHFIFCLGSLHLPQYQYAVPSTPTNHYIVTEGFLYLVFHCFTLDIWATSARVALMAAFLMFYYK